MPWTNEEIRSDRVALRCPTEADKPLIKQLMGDVEVRRYLGGPLDQEGLAAIDGATVGERWGAFVVANNTTNNTIGLCGFERESHGELEISYSLHPDFWGQGLATEAVGIALDWAWANTSDNSLIAVTQTANLRSLRLLETVGFTVEKALVEWNAEQTQLRIHRP